MKKAGETDQDGVLDEAYLHHGGFSSWSVYGDERRTPLEILQETEDEALERFESGELLMEMFDLVLTGWSREACVEKVAARVLSLAASLSHWGGRGVPMLGARKVIGERVELARRVLDYWFVNERKSAGKVDGVRVARNVMGMAKYVNHGEFDDWSLTMIGKACRETPAAAMERVKRLCEKPVRLSGGKAKATWQQGDGQRAGSSEAQKRFHRSGNGAVRKRNPKTKKD